MASETVQRVIPLQYYSGNRFFSDWQRGSIRFWASQYKDAYYDAQVKS